MFLSIVSNLYKYLKSKASDEITSFSERNYIRIIYIEMEFILWYLCYWITYSKIYSK